MIDCELFSPNNTYNSQKQRKTLLLLNHILCAMLYPSINLHLPCTTEDATSAKYKLEAKLHACRRKGQKMLFFVHGNLDLQTRPSKGQNTSSMGIWCKSVRQFPTIFHTQTKTHRLTAPKNGTFRSSLHAVIKYFIIF